MVVAIRINRIFSLIRAARGTAAYTHSLHYAFCSNVHLSETASGRINGEHDGFATEFVDFLDEIFGC